VTDVGVQHVVDNRSTYQALIKHLSKHGERLKKRPEARSSGLLACEPVGTSGSKTESLWLQQGGVCDRRSTSK
jgi:hypothetical protein